MNMYIARKLKEKNIAEYLLYMWQVEDIIRAHHLDTDELRHNYLEQFRAGDDAQKQLEEWYAALTDSMRKEGLQEQGHLKANRETLARLSDLHRRLIHSGKHPDYTQAYHKALPYIVELRAKNGHKDEPELETCFDALYGLMILRLKHQDISEATAHATEDIAQLLKLLAACYQQEQAGTLEL